MGDVTCVEPLSPQNKVQNVQVLAPENVAVLPQGAAVAMHDGGHGQTEGDNVSAGSPQPPRRDFVLKEGLVECEESLHGNGALFRIQRNLWRRFLHCNTPLHSNSRVLGERASWFPAGLSQGWEQIHAFVV
jgi:hypothetical protein